MADNGVLPAQAASDDERRARMADLVNDFRAGRPGAIDGLVAELTPVLWQVARATGLSRTDSEDVVQTVWVSLLSHLDAIHTPGALMAWLMTTTRREAWRVSKAARKLALADQEWLIAIPDEGGSSEERAIMMDEYRKLRAAFLTLPRRCQELLRIVVFIPRPDYTEVADRLGMARGSVGPTRGRCLAKLRVALSSDGGER